MTRTAEQTTALQELHRVVFEAPDERFHMRKVIEQASCGTARCAIGWCAVDQWFRDNTKIRDYILDNGITSSFLFEKDGFLDGTFGITHSEAMDLFGGQLEPFIKPHAVKKHEVLWNIKELLAGRTTRPYRAVYSADRRDRNTVPVGAR